MFGTWKTSVLGAAVLVAMSGSAMAAGTASVQGGNVHFTGTVIDAACSVAMGDAGSNVEVDMGQVRSAKFTAVDMVANQKVPFTITLADCDTTVSANAQVTFNGNGVAGKTSVLANGAGPGSAAGVGIQIYDNTGATLNLGVASAKTALINGNNTLHFSADYISTAAAVVSGSVDATATFTMTYS
ncbi:Type-1A pilin [Buttiauxella agrestis]|uniref:Type-1A pilin n=1 Tax=Buttiauxella agrestis TaxID=82977 RepID=A0A381KNG7_9ENTR|nr:fimbrial protein [Buttiauxella agrestis]SUY92924.1 Type-1A pilin [Buttiauxella agrestis]